MQGEANQMHVKQKKSPEDRKPLLDHMDFQSQSVVLLKQMGRFEFAMLLGRKAFRTHTKQFFQTIPLLQSRANAVVDILVN